jgi:hypothetical protein
MTIEESAGGWRRHNAAASKWMDWPQGTFANTGVSHRTGNAVLPLIPIKYRPRRAMENYHVLWEATWEPVPPVDPFLLRRIDESDLWLVLAMWELTEVERSVLATRIANA